jgi:hypothetical protein
MRFVSGTTDKRRGIGDRPQTLNFLHWYQSRWLIMDRRKLCRRSSSTPLRTASRDSDRSIADCFRIDAPLRSTEVGPSLRPPIAVMFSLSVCKILVGEKDLFLQNLLPVVSDSAANSLASSSADERSRNQFVDGAFPSKSGRSGGDHVVGEIATELRNS